MLHFVLYAHYFPQSIKEKAEVAWVQTGVNKWHKMKGAGTEKHEKLAIHFKSESHQASFASYCSVIQRSKHINVELDKAKGWHNFKMLMILHTTVMLFVYC